jgi:hypothetical protein
MSSKFHLLPNLAFIVTVPKIQMATLVLISLPNETKVGCKYPPKTLSP